MRKKVTCTILIIAIVAIGGIFWPKEETKNYITLVDLPEMYEEKEVPTFNKSNINGNVSKYTIKSIEDICIYSINKTHFIIAENTNKSEARYYLETATNEKCEPIAITITGNYMILKNEKGEKIATEIKQSTEQQSTELPQQIPFRKLAEFERNSLFIIEN